MERSDGMQLETNLSMRGSLDERRPVPPLVSALLDAAHVDHHDSKEPLSTAQYNMFNWQVAEATQVSKAIKTRGGRSRPGSGASDGCGITKRETGGSLFAESMLSFQLDQGGLPSSDLEITCQYDEVFQDADPTGRPGGEVRPRPQAHIGPVAFLFRWYTKRATQFPAGFPRPEDIPDAPPLPPADPIGRACSSQPPAGHSKVRRASSDSMAQQQQQQQHLQQSCSASGRSTRDTTANTGLSQAHSSPAPSPSVSASGLDAAAAASMWKEGLPPSGGRSLNLAPDPVMGLTELTEMLEELEVVPHRVSRQDVAEAFRAATLVPSDPPNMLPKAQTCPEALRYPQFCDVLVRLALAAEALDAAGGREGRLPRQPKPPAAAVLALMEATGLSSANISAFKRKLDSLARMASDRGAQRKAIKWMYINAPSAMQAARSGPGRLAPLEGGWTVDSPSRAPEELHSVLMSSDLATTGRYIPRWMEFPGPALNLGTMNPGEVRCLRVVLRNRSANTMSLRVDTSGAASNLQCTFSEQSLPAGMPRVIEVQARFHEPGEYAGDLLIFSRTKKDEMQALNIVPFYAMVGGVDPEARFARTCSERSALSRKNFAGRPGPETTAAVAANLRTPRSSWASASGSQLLGGRSINASSTRPPVAPVTRQPLAV